MKLLLCLAAIALTVGCSGSKSINLRYCSMQQNGDYLLAALLPLAQTDFLNQSVDYGARLALAEINAGGGIHNKTLGLVECDDAGNPNQGVLAVHEAAQYSNLVGYVGPLFSGVALAAAAALPSVQKPAISPSATSIALTTVADGNFFFRTVVSDAVQGTVAAAIAVRQGYQKISVLHEQDAYTAGLAAAFSTAFQARGGQTQDLPFDPANSSGETQSIASAATFGPDAIYVAPELVADGATLAQEIGSSSWPGNKQPKLLFPDSCDDPTLVSLVGNDAYLAGTFGTIAAVPAGATYNGFASRFQTKWTEAPPAYSANAYDATYLLAIAAQVAADPTNGQLVREALQAHTGPPGANTVAGGDWAAVRTAITNGGVDYDGASGPVDFDANGDVAGNIQEWQVTSGQLQNVPTSSTGGCWTAEAMPCGA